MSYRYMRLLLMFDLPTTTSTDLKNYRTFHKQIQSDGFFMLQESIYIKLVLNLSSAHMLRYKVRNYAPSKGNICIITLTEKQFNGMEYINGKEGQIQIDSTERMTVL